jgi:SAM-dependent methyltransferase
MADENKVQWVYASKDRDELATRYDKWAKDYDADLEADFDWKGAALAADALAKYVSSDSRVMDVGVGTGLAGWELAKGWYRGLQVGILGEKLDHYAADSYDAALATGVFTEGHAPASGFDEVVRIIKPGGYFVITLREDIYESHGFKAKEEELATAGKMKLVEASEPLALLPKGEPDIRHQIRVYEILN